MADEMFSMSVYGEPRFASVMRKTDSWFRDHEITTSKATSDPVYMNWNLVKYVHKRACKVTFTSKTCMRSCRIFQFLPWCVVHVFFVIVSPLSFIRLVDKVYHLGLLCCVSLKYEIIRVKHSNYTNVPIFGSRFFLLSQGYSVIFLC